MVPRDICFVCRDGSFWFPRQRLVWQLLAGASGALLGLVGVMLAITTKRGGAYMRELRSRLVSSVVILLFSGFPAWDR